jgi:lipopolysaccharide assembly outer membrane protein LptD (OstA)
VTIQPGGGAGVRRLVARCLVAICLARTAAAQLLPRAESDAREVAIDAESISYDQRANTVTAKGGVVIRRGETEVRADEVRVNQTTNDVVARGAVTVTDPEGTLFADAVHLNLDEETGTLQHGAITSRAALFAARRPHREGHRAELSYRERQVHHVPLR